MLCAPRCQVTAHISSGLHIIVAPPTQTAPTSHPKSCGWGRKKNKIKPIFGVQNHVWQSTEAHHIHFYKYAHSSFCVSRKRTLLICTSFKLSDTPKEKSTRNLPQHQHSAAFHFKYIHKPQISLIVISVGKTL